MVACHRRLHHARGEYRIQLLRNERVFPSFEREFGWSRTAISGAFSLARIESEFLGPIEGYLTDRISLPSIKESFQFDS
jgi:hypothetical protein